MAVVTRPPREHRESPREHRESQASQSTVRRSFCARSTHPAEWRTTSKYSLRFLELATTRRCCTRPAEYNSTPNQSGCHNVRMQRTPRSSRQLESVAHAQIPLEIPEAHAAVCLHSRQVADAARISRAPHKKTKTQTTRGCHDSHATTRKCSGHSEPFRAEKQQ